MTAPRLGIQTTHPSRFTPAPAGSSESGRRRRAGSPRSQPAAALPSLASFLWPPASSPRRRTLAPGLTIGPIGIGTWAWGNRFLYQYREEEDAALADAYAAALAAGLNLFDTGDSYGTGRLSGRSESLLGQFRAQGLGGARAPLPVVVATKIAPYPWRLTSGQWLAAAEASAGRTGGLALAQLHWSTSTYAPWQERATWDGLIKAYDAGLCSAVGVSNFGPAQLQKVVRYLGKAGVPVATTQVQCSLLSAGPGTRAALSAAADLGVAVLAYSPLALGMLSGAYGPAGRDGGGRQEEAPTPRLGHYPAGPRGALFRSILPKASPLLTVVAGIAAAKRCTPSQVALAWCLDLDTVPIPGARCAAHVQAHTGALKVRLSPGDVAALDGAASVLGKATMPQNVFATR